MKVWHTAAPSVKRISCRYNYHQKAGDTARYSLTKKPFFLHFCQTDFGCTNCLDSSLPAFVPVFFLTVMRADSLIDCLNERAADR